MPEVFSDETFTPIFHPADPPFQGTLTFPESSRVWTVFDVLLATKDEIPRLWFDVIRIGLASIAQGHSYPTASAQELPVWRMGPLSTHHEVELRDLISRSRTSLEESQFRFFLDALADAVPRLSRYLLASDEPSKIAGAPELTVVAQGFLSAHPKPHPGLYRWAQTHGVVDLPREKIPDLSLRIEVGAQGDPNALCAVLQIQTPSADGLETPTVDSVGKLWGQMAREDRSRVALALRRAGQRWSPLTRFLDGPVPDSVVFDDDEIADLVGVAGPVLEDLGIAVLWPQGIAVGCDVAGEIGDFLPEQPMESLSGDSQSLASVRPVPFGENSLFTFRWRIALGDVELTEEELAELANSLRPVVRMRQQWIVLNDSTKTALSSSVQKPLPAVSALAMALNGVTDVEGRSVPVRTTGRIAELERVLLAAVPPHKDERQGGGNEIYGRSSMFEVRREVPRALDAQLRDYQRDGLDWLERMTALGLGGVLADDMGLGKTITLIALHLRRQEDSSTAGPTLVICPASLLGNWHREIHRFAPGTAVLRFHGPDRKLPTSFAVKEDLIVLTTYATMRSDATSEIAALANVQWGLVVADEAQQVKNPATRTARALRAIPAAARIALTGTPVENSLEELWAILDWTTPGLLGPRAQFRARWAIPITEDADPRIAARFARLIRPFVLRRTKADPKIAPELPPKTLTDRPVALSEEQVGLYEALLQRAMKEIENAAGIARRGLIVSLLTGLKQICNHPAHFLHEKPRSFGASFAARSGKVELLDELLDTIISEQGAALVFTQYVAMAHLIAGHLRARHIDHLLLHGGTPVPQREKLVDQFQHGEAPVFLLSLKAAGTGLNLTRADHVIHLDRWWNPAVEDQATDRAYRIGQTRPVQVHRLIAEGTIEDRIAEMLATKRDLADRVLTSGESALTELSNAELSALVELRRSA